MMKKYRQSFLLLLCVALLMPLQAGERTIPVDVFVMIDKSLSMADPGKFDSLHQWVRDHLIGQILIDGDWITIYQFYGKTNNLLTMTVQNDTDRQKVIQTIDAIKPDGQYTDIGLALDTIKKALKQRGENDRLKILLLLTDLKQEAAWTSRYAGSPEKFESPYLAEARILPHDAWYEITLDMDIQDLVVKNSKELFSSIEETRGQSKEHPTDGMEINTETGEINGSDGAELPSDKTGGLTKDFMTLPFSTLLMIVSVIVLASTASILLLHNKRKKEREQAKTQE